jgi:hypothetical protein
MIPFKKIWLVLFLMFLQFTLNTASSFVPQGFFFYFILSLACLNLIIAATLSLPHKIFSPTVSCLLWFLMIAKDILPKSSIPEVFLTILWGLSMILIIVEGYLLLLKSRKLADGNPE